MVEFTVLGRSFSIKEGLLAIKACFFTFNFGFGTVFPYLALQMSQLGLSYEDIGLIYGLYPIVTVFAAPISGFIGDRFGYRPVLIVYTILAGVIGTSFNFIPQFGVQERHPVATLLHETDGTSVFKSITWPLCDGHNGTVANVTAAACATSLAGMDLSDLSSHLVCKENLMPSSNFVFSQATVAEVGRNGTFCESRNSDLNNSTSSGQEIRLELRRGFDDLMRPVCPLQLVTCQVSADFTTMQSCYHAFGSHTTTFWMYLGLRTAFVWSMIAVFSTFDGSAVQLANEHGSDYSNIFLFAMLAQVFCSFLPALIIKHPDSSTEDVNYLPAFYVMDAFLLLTCLLVLKLKVNKIDTGERTWNSVKKTMTKPALLLYSLVAAFGLGWGVQDSYLAVYLKTKMEATTLIFSLGFASSSVASLLMSFVAKPVINRIGSLNAIFIAIVVQGGRFVIYSLVTEVPPWYYIGLTFLDAFTQTLNWVATINYMYVLAPPDLVATMASICNVLAFVLAKGLGSLLGGQLEARTPLGITGVFQVAFGVTSALGLVSLAIYYTVGKRWEREVVERKEELLAKARGFIHEEVVEEVDDDKED